MTRAGQSELEAALHRLRSTMARVQAEAELLELKGGALGGLLEGLGEAFAHLSTAEDTIHASDAREAPPLAADMPVLLDDDVRLAILHIRQLELAGIYASLTLSLRAALGHARLGHRIVVDLSVLGAMDPEDVQALRRLKPVVLTGSSGREAAQLAAYIGASDVLLKPVNVDALIRSLQIGSETAGP